MTEKNFNHVVAFGIDTVELASERCVITGRCYGGDISIGTSFDAVYRRLYGRINDSISGHSVPLDVKRICLEVEAVEVFWKPANSIPTGFSGKLTLRGDGSQKLQKCYILGCMIDIKQEWTIYSRDTSILRE